MSGRLGGCPLPSVRVPSATVRQSGDESMLIRHLDTQDLPERAPTRSQERASRIRSEIASLAERLDQVPEQIRIHARLAVELDHTLTLRCA